MREAPLSAEQPEAQEEPRLPGQDADPRRPRGAEDAPPARSGPALGLTGRVRDRATFELLRRARARREGPVTLRFAAAIPGGEPRVAYAVGRVAGGAVARNRVRRRLRAAVAVCEEDLRPGGAYLFGAGRDVAATSYEALVSAVSRLARAAGGDR